MRKTLQYIDAEDKAKLFTNLLASQRSGERAIKQTTNTLYRFRHSDMPRYRERHNVIIDWVVSIEAHY